MPFLDQKKPGKKPINFWTKIIYKLFFHVTVHSGRPPPPLNSDEINEDEDEDPEVDDDKLDHHGGVEMFEISPSLNGTLKIDITLTPNIAGCSHQNPMFLEKEKTAFVQTAGT